MQSKRGITPDLNHNLHFHKIPQVIHMDIKVWVLHFYIILVLKLHIGASNQFSVRTINSQPQSWGFSLKWDYTSLKGLREWGNM